MSAAKKQRHKEDWLFKVVGFAACHDHLSLAAVNNLLQLS